MIRPPPRGDDVAAWVDEARAYFRGGDIAGFEAWSHTLLQQVIADHIGSLPEAFDPKPWAGVGAHAPWSGYARCCLALALSRDNVDDHRLIDALTRELAGALAGLPSAPDEIVEPAVALLADSERDDALVYLDAVERVHTGQEAALEFCRAAAHWTYSDAATALALERSVAADPLSANTWHCLAKALLVWRVGGERDAPANAAERELEAHERAIALYDSKDQRPVDAWVPTVGKYSFSVDWDRQEEMRERTFLLVELDRLELALTSARELLGVAPESWRSHSAAGHVLRKLGRDLEADAAYTDAVAWLRENAGDEARDVSYVWLDRASVRVRLGRERDALADLARAIELWPVLATYGSDLPSFTDPNVRVELDGVLLAGQERAAREAREERRSKHEELRAEIADSTDAGDAVRKIVLEGFDALAPSATSADAARALEAAMAALRQLVSADPKARDEIDSSGLDLKLESLARLYDVKGFSADFD